MTTVDCGREEDVLDALTSGRWPERVDCELLSHVADCSICTDVVEVASAVLEVRANEPVEARIPSSAVMWWRAQMRARQEASREAARPITVAQVVASVAAIVLIRRIGVSAALMIAPLIYLAGFLVMGAASDGMRTQESQKLLNFGFQFFDAVKLYGKDQEVSRLRVWKGAQNIVRAGFLEDFTLSLPKGMAENLKASLVSQQPLIDLHNELGTTQP